MLIVVRLKKRWMTFETGDVGDENEPEVESLIPDKEEVIPVKIVGFSVEDPYEGE